MDKAADALALTQEFKKKLDEIKLPGLAIIVHPSGEQMNWAYRGGPGQMLDLVEGMKAQLMKDLGRATPTVDNCIHLNKNQ